MHKFILALPLVFMAACTNTEGGVPMPPSITPETLMSTSPSSLKDSQVCEYSVAADAWVVWLDDWGTFASDVLGRDINVKDTIDNLTNRSEQLKRVAAARNICN